MKKILGTAALLLSFSTLTTAQISADKTEESKPSRDFFMLQLSHDGWATSENISTGFNRGIGAYINYDYVLGNKEVSNLSFSIGIGIRSSNIFMKDNYFSLAKDTKTMELTPVDSATKNHKLASTYLEVPLELRFFGNKHNRNKGFKAAIGAKVGFNVDGNTKYKTALSSHWITEKEKSTRFHQKWMLTPTVRLGYGNFSLFASYSVTNLFKADMGPKINPFQVGICISGL